MLHLLAGFFANVPDYAATWVAWLAERAGRLASGQGAWVVVGAVLAFASNRVLQGMQRRNQRRLAMMQVATNLRHWMNRVRMRVEHTINWDSSEGHGGIAYTEIPEFRFESSLEQVALLDRKTAKRVFDLIHRKDDVNSGIEATSEYQSEDDAIDAFRGGAAALCLDALEIYQDISKRIGWKERVFSDYSKTTMQGEVARLRSLEQDQGAAALAMREMFKDANATPGP
jgi:hypothetical protein